MMATMTLLKEWQSGERVCDVRYKAASHTCAIFWSAINCASVLRTADSKRPTSGQAEGISSRCWYYHACGRQFFTYSCAFICNCACVWASRRKRRMAKMLTTTYQRHVFVTHALCMRRTVWMHCAPVRTVSQKTKVLGCKCWKGL